MSDINSESYEDSIETIKSPHDIAIGIYPQEADIAIVSTDNQGSPGELNSYVFNALGYSQSDLPNAEDLKTGFYLLVKKDKKSIIFIVTVNCDTSISNLQTSFDLQKNLYNALIEFRKWFINKKVWIPLLGTGAGGLSLIESYTIIARVINKFQKDSPTRTRFYISLPKNEQALEIVNLCRSTPLESSIAKEFLLTNKNKFYLINTSIGDYTTIKSYSENVWKILKDENYSKKINEINTGDYLLFYTEELFADSSSISNYNFYRVRSIAIVADNPHDGVLLIVKWIISSLFIDIPNLTKNFSEKSSYYSEILISDFNLTLSILSKLDKTQLDCLISSSSKSNSIVGLICDSDKGADYLDISKDVTAFARVIAAKSFEPPLAIALFGKWGSGKSFFMRKLKEQVIYLSEKYTNGIYCNGIAHIQFNAWSYLDANLWASIVSKIFEGLNEYISKNSHSSDAKKEIEAHLNSKLTITQEEIAILENRKQSFKEQITSLEEQKKQIDGELQEKLNRIGSNTLWNVLQTVEKKFNVKGRISQSLNENSSFIKTKEELQKVVPEKYWNNPHEAYAQARSNFTFLKEFFNIEKLKWNIIILLGIFLLILFVPLVADKLSKIYFIIPQAGLSFLVLVGAIWKRAETVYKYLQPIVTSFWNIKEEYDSQINEATSKHEQDEKVLRLEIEKARAQILQITEQIQKANAEKADLEYKINNALATEALYSFIDKRSKSEDYKKYLGIISTIRKDFEILNDLFKDSKEEIKNNTDEYKKKKEEIDKFRRCFEKPLERIILYIDDLDRCPEENVIQVLDAVNLLMAFPLFIVIVGVDARWIKNALIKKHALQFAGKVAGFEQVGEQFEMIEPSNYLEKIFQIPFQLKDADDDKVKSMIKKLAEIKPDIENSELEDSKSSNNEINPAQNETSDKGRNMQSKNKGLLESNKNESFGKSLEHDFYMEEKPEALVLIDDEVKLMQEMSVIIGNNPRAIKRFVNIYRIVKAHEDFYNNPDSLAEDLLVILFLLALPLGEFKAFYKPLEEYFCIEANKQKYLNEFMQQTKGTEEHKYLQSKLNDLLESKDTLVKLTSINMESFYEQNKLIKRFTFRNI